jgi:hypothetical protein
MPSTPNRAFRDQSVFDLREHGANAPRVSSSSHSFTHQIQFLQRTAGNIAVSTLLAADGRFGLKATLGIPTTLVQRDVDAGTSPMDPASYSTFGEWLRSLPADAIDYAAIDVTGKIASELPNLARLVKDLKADCADVALLLGHYYLQAHGETKLIKSTDSTAKSKTVTYKLGAGVSKSELRRALSNLGTVNFQETRRKFALVQYYGGSAPWKNLKKLLAAGLGPGDVLVWRKLPGISGNFSGHAQTVQFINPYVAPPGPGDAGTSRPGSIAVLQGTMESGAPVSQIQSRQLEFKLLTGRDDGDGDITYQPDGEEEFYGAGKW